MKKFLYVFLIIFSFVLINSCTPLMNDLEKIYEEDDPTQDPIKESKISIVNFIGNSQVDGILFAQVLDADGNPVGGEISYQWQYFDEQSNEWINIDGAVKATLECTKDYEGKKIKVVVTQGESSITSEEIVITPAPAEIKKVETVVIIGNGKVDDILFAQPLDADGNFVAGKLSYQWQCFNDSTNEWVNIENAVDATFECSESYLNKKIKVVVTQDETEIESGEKTIYADYIPQNDGTISEIIISGTASYDGIIFATPIDNNGNLVDGKITYKWEYYDETSNKWIEIPAQKTSSFRINDKNLIGKNIRVTSTKNNISFTSEPIEAKKGTLVPSVFEIEIPIVTEHEAIDPDEIKITLKDKYGNDVVIKDIDYPDYTIDESFDTTIKIFTDEYEVITKQEYIRVKWRNVEDDEVPELFEGQENGTFKFNELTNYTTLYYMEYSYDGGTTWTKSLDDFTPTSRFILLRWEGDCYDSQTGRYAIYPSDPYELAYKPAKFSVVNFTLDQSDVELTFDEATGTLTMEEGYDMYVWFVKTGYHPAQDGELMIGMGMGLIYGIDPDYPNKFNLAKFFEEIEEDDPDTLKFIREDNYGDPWPEYGRPGKYYVQAVAVMTDFNTGMNIIPYSSTCWIELK